MSTQEQALVERQYRQRVAAILSPAELASYEAYEQRLLEAAAKRDSRPIEPTSDEQAALDKLAADTQAAALHKQLLVLMRIETLPQ